MNVLLWSDVYPPLHGGLEKFLRTLARGLVQRGHSVLVVTSHLEDSTLPDREWDEGVDVCRLPLLPVLHFNDMRGTLALIRAVSDLKRTFKPTVVHVHGEAPSAFFHVQTQSAWACPTLLTVHTAVVNYNVDADTLMGRLLTGAAHISTVSSIMRDRLQAALPAVRGKVSVIHNALPPVATNAAAPPTADPVVFTCGRFSQEKGFDVMLEAFAHVHASIPSAALILAGDGQDEASLKQGADALGISGSVEFPGWLSPENVAARMRISSVVVVPSRYEEGFGLVALEAAQLGIPVVATRVGGLQEVVVDGETGLLVPSEDRVAMADAIVRLLRDPDLRQSLGNRARAHAVRRFDLDRMLTQYEGIYNAATAHDPAPAPSSIAA